jgi:hypothetical protein
MSTEIKKIYKPYTSTTHDFWFDATNPIVDFVSSYSEYLGEGIKQIQVIIYYNILLFLPIILLSQTAYTIFYGGLVVDPQLSWVHLFSFTAISATGKVYFNTKSKENEPYPYSTGLLVSVSAFVLPMLPQTYHFPFAIGIIHAIGILSSGRIGLKFGVFSGHLNPDGKFEDKKNIIDEESLNSFSIASVCILSVLSVLLYVNPAEYLIVIQAITAYIVSVKLYDYINKLVPYIDSKHSGARWMIESRSIPLAGALLLLVNSQTPLIVPSIMIAFVMIGVIEFKYFAARAASIQFGDDDSMFQQADMSPINDVNINDITEQYRAVELEETDGKKSIEGIVIDINAKVGILPEQNRMGHTQIANTIYRLIMMRNFYAELNRNSEPENMRNDRRKIQSAITYLSEHIVDQYDSYEDALGNTFISGAPKVVRKELFIRFGDENVTSSDLVVSGQKEPNPKNYISR